MRRFVRRVRIRRLETSSSLVNPDYNAGMCGEAPVEAIDPNEIRFSQRTAGGNGRAQRLRESMGANGWRGDPVDGVQAAEGVVTIDNTRVAVARELKIEAVPVRVHQPDEPLPQNMRGRFGTSTTWGEALAHRTGAQRPDPLPPVGTLDPPSMPGA